MNKSKFNEGDRPDGIPESDRLSNNDYHILFFEIEHHLLVDHLSELIGKDKGTISAKFGSIAIDIINSRSVEQNQNDVNQLKDVFAKTVIPEFND